MLRVLQLVLAVVLLVALGVGVVFYLSYGAPDPPAEARLDGLTAGATVEWGADGLPPRVTVATDADALAALGFAQASDHVWTLVLWRQAAEGRLAEWLGPGVLAADRVARSLGLARDARRAYDALAPADRAALTRFADGVNAAFATRHARRDAFVTLVGAPLEPWQPWDALAVERLAAWIGTRLDPPVEAWRLPSVRAFVVGDRLLRDVLCADGYDASRAWVAADTAGARFVAQLAAGSSALPALADAEVVVGDRRRVVVAWPGTPFPVAGTDGARAWAARPTTTAAFEPAPLPAGVRARAERLRAADGREDVALVVQDADGLYFAPERLPDAPRAVRPPPPRPAPARPALPPRPDSAQSDSSPRRPALPADTLAAAPDTTRRPVVPAGPPPLRSWRLVWTGLGPRTDAAGWLRLWRGPATLHLFDGGLLVATGPAWRGAGPVTALPIGAVLAGAPTGASLAARLRVLPPGAPAEADAVSPWALGLVGPLRDRLDPRTLRGPAEREAYEYLRNWGGDYEGPSVGATIFTAWLAAHGRLLDRPPEEAARDTLFFAAVRAGQSFRAAVAELRGRYGLDVAAWRWDRARPAERRFPVWSVADGYRFALRARARFGPFRAAAAGHATTLRFAPGDPDGHLTAAHTLVLLASGDVLLTRPIYAPGQFLARYRLQDQPLRTVTVGRDARAPGLTTRLTP